MSHDMIGRRSRWPRRSRPGQAGLGLGQVFALIFGFLAGPGRVAAQPPSPSDLAARAKRIHAEAIVLDTHIDTTQRLLQPGWSFFDEVTVKRCRPRKL